MLPVKTALVIMMGLHGLPHAVALAAEDEAPATPKVHVVMLAGDQADENGAAPQIVKFNAVAVAGTNATEADDGDVIFLDAGAGADGQQKRVIKLRRAHQGHGQPGDIEAGGPWIGIQFGPVPRALSAQLNLAPETGQMILNVAEGSPADLAGFQQYDVITQIDGRPVPSHMGEFLDIVRTFTSNETHTFTLMRGGQQIQTNVTVAARPAPDVKLTYKYESEIEELSRGRMFGRGGMMEKDDQGNWVFKGFDLQNPPDFFKALPDVHDFDFNIALPGGLGGNQVFLHKTQGEEIRVSRDESGQVTVTRTLTENGNETTTTTTYASVDEFKAQEPELSKKFHFGDGFGFRYHGSPLDAADWSQMLDAADWNQFSLKLDEDVRALLDEHLKQLQDMDLNVPHHPDPPRMRVLMGRPSTRFEATPEGQIKVTTRAGEDELVETFNSVEDMQSQRPDLYQKYQRFQERAARP